MRKQITPQKNCRASPHRLASYKKYKIRRFRSKIYQLEHSTPNQSSVSHSINQQSANTPNQVPSKSDSPKTHSSNHHSRAESTPQAKEDSNLSYKPTVQILENIHPIDIPPIQSHQDIPITPQSLYSDNLQINLLSIFNSQSNSDTDSDKENMNPDSDPINDPLYKIQSHTVTTTIKTLISI